MNIRKIPIEIEVIGSINPRNSAPRDSGRRVGIRKANMPVASDAQNFGIAVAIRKMANSRRPKLNQSFRSDCEAGESRPGRCLGLRLM